MTTSTLLLFLTFLFHTALRADDHGDKSLKGLLVTGGGHHDYGFQQNVIMEGVTQRLPVQ